MRRASGVVACVTGLLVAGLMFGMQLSAGFAGPLGGPLGPFLHLIIFFAVMLGAYGLLVRVLFPPGSTPSWIGLGELTPDSWWPRLVLVAVSALLIVLVPRAMTGAMRPDLWALLLSQSLGWLAVTLLRERPTGPTPRPQPPPETRDPRDVALSRLRYLMELPGYRGELVFSRFVEQRAPVWHAVERDGGVVDFGAELVRLYPLLGGSLDQILTAPSAARSPGAGSRPRFYRQQGRLMEALFRENEPSPQDRLVVLGSAPGSGRSTACGVAALTACAAHAKTSLFVYVDERERDAGLDAMRRLIERSGWSWRVSVGAASSDTDLDQAIQSQADLLFASLRDIELRLLPRAALLDTYFANLGLLVVEDVDRGEGRALSHGAYLLRRTLFQARFRGARPASVFTAYGLVNAAEIVRQLSGEQEVLEVAEDGAPSSPCMVCLWMPAFDRAGVQNAFVRQSFQVSACRVAASAVSGLGLNTAACCFFSPLGPAEVAEIEAAAVRFCRQAEVGGGRGRSLASSFSVFSGFSAIPADRFGTFDMVVTIGLPDQLAAIGDVIPRLLRPGGVAVLVLDGQPLSAWVARDPERLLFGQASRKQRHWLNTDDRLLLRHHFAAWVRETRQAAGVSGPEGPFVRLDEVRRVFGDYGLQAVNELLGARGWERDTEVDSAGVEQVGVYVGLPPEGTERLAFPLLSPATIDLVDAASATTLGSVETQRCGESVFPNAIVHLPAGRFVVIEVDERRALLQEQALFQNLDLASPATARLPATVRTSRIFDVEVLIESRGAEIVEDQLTLQLVRGQVRETNRLYQRWPMSLSWDEAVTAELRGERDLDDVPVILLTTAATPEPALHLVKHGIKLLLPHYVRDAAELIEVARVGIQPQIAIYPRVATANRLVESTWTMLTSGDGLRLLLAEVFELLVSCPCAGGCGGCAITLSCHVDRPSAAARGLDKAGAIRYLASVLGREYLNRADRWARVQAGVSQLEDLFDLRDEVVAGDTALLRRLIFNDNLPRSIPAELAGRSVDAGLGFRRPLVPVDFMGDDAPGGVAGLYAGADGVRARPGMPWPAAFQVLVHEFTHNWQLEPDSEGRMERAFLADQRPETFQGRIVLEGFARWVEFKTAAFFANRSEMVATDLWKDDEYGEGFDVVKAIEDQAGWMAVMNFVTWNYRRGFDYEAILQREVAPALRRAAARPPQSDVEVGTGGAGASGVQPPQPPPGGEVQPAGES